MTAMQDSSQRVRVLVEELGSSDPGVRIRARANLVAEHRLASVPLIHRLSDSNTLAVWEAAKTLEAIADPAAAEPLVETLEHKDTGVRWVAAEALIAIGREGVRQVLFALLTRAKSVWLCEGAHHVLSVYARRHHADSLAPVLDAIVGFEPAVTTPPAALAALHELDQSQTPSRR